MPTSLATALIMIQWLFIIIFFTFSMLLSIVDVLGSQVVIIFTAFLKMFAPLVNLFIHIWPTRSNIKFSNIVLLFIPFLCQNLMQTVPLFPHTKITKHMKTYVTFSTANNELNIQYSYHCQDTSGTSTNTTTKYYGIWTYTAPKIQKYFVFSDHTSDIQLHYFNIIFFLIKCITLKES